ncbi:MULTISPECIES: hypothetical protein [Micromonospora]|uniref:Uncharacterized protein n=1 Tax=Micromonospora maris TaxID=1003110 RepID=A0A9X0LG07_9ACTN|nr:MULTISPECIES: hypothetical protein [Micromonospora]KUJ49069.1 hypothetical protein ADL17_08895 [Micromonospora maris]RUL91934.1 hypothetical protein EG812_18485 [Verrucosispora sp. FIM060022]
MSASGREPQPATNLVWAPDDVRAGIEQQVQPQQSLPGRAARAATTAFIFVALPAFVVFTATTLVAPSVTDDAGVGRVALWAGQVAVLIAIGAAVGALRTPADQPEPPTTWSIVRRLGWHLLSTGACTALVLVLHGLAVGQILTLALLLVGVLHLVPLIVARLLSRAAGRGRAA